MVTRAIFVLLSALAGMALFLRAQDPSREFLLMGLGMGGVAGGLILAGEYALRRLSFGIIVGGAVGLAGGLILTGLVEWVGSAVFDVETFLFHIGGLVFLLGLPYLGLAMGARFGNEQFPGLDQGPTAAGASHASLKVLDTSVIIDGRVADLCETGFLEGPFLVPHFILNELQHIADSSDSLKRARGRRGLDILNKIQKMSGIDVRIIDEDFPHVKE
ncbi:MAG: PIN/TRAM domain-containing protein, partial [Nitrospira sp.]